MRDLKKYLPIFFLFLSIFLIFFIFNQALLLSAVSLEVTYAGSIDCDTKYPDAYTGKSYMGNIRLSNLDRTKRYVVTFTDIYSGSYYVICRTLPNVTSDLCGYNIWLYKCQKFSTPSINIEFRVWEERGNTWILETSRTVSFPTDPPTQSPPPSPSSTFGYEFIIEWLGKVLSIFRR